MYTNYKQISRRIISSLLLVFAVQACSDSDPEPVLQPSFEAYEPHSGVAGTELMIRGNNFGEESGRVQVWVNDVNAEVVSVTDTRIYAIVPGAAGSGEVRIVVGDHEFIPSEAFTFEFTRNVYTYSGSGAAVSVDGTLKQASFNRPYWLAYDHKDKAVFVLEEGRKVRRIKDGAVETVASLTGSVNNPRSISMSITGDTLFIGNDNAGNNNNVTVAILTRATGFSEQQDYVKSQNATRHVNYAGIHPADGTLIFYCWPRKLYKYNPGTGQPELLYDLAGVPGINGDFYANFAFSPEGTEMYIIAKYPYIGVLKASYDPETHTVTGGFQHLAGTGSWGAEDGQGAAASFDQPAQAVVGKDGNIYIAEKFNHWIRQVTPQGAVKVYAGDGGAQNQGYLDGEMSIAKFNEPEGVVFDDEGNMYVADLRNSRIRVIKNE